MAKMPSLKEEIFLYKSIQEAFSPPHKCLPKNYIGIHNIIKKEMYNISPYQSIRKKNILLCKTMYVNYS